MSHLREEFRLRRFQEVPGTNYGTPKDVGFSSRRRARPA